MQRSGTCEKRGNVVACPIVAALIAQPIRFDSLRLAKILPGYAAAAELIRLIDRFNASKQSASICVPTISLMMASAFEIGMAAR